MPLFERQFGIDYSGSMTSSTRLSAIQVYAAIGAMPEKVSPPDPYRNNIRNWNRTEVAQWLIEQTDGPRYIAGLDHGFSFPVDYFRRQRIDSWPHLLADTVAKWPLDQPHSMVEDLIRRAPVSGNYHELRCCERLTGSARSVFDFRKRPGIVAYSTLSGMPWLKKIRDVVGNKVHFWPFDGWEVQEGKHVIAEVYPTLFRRRYENVGRTADEHDAYVTARWLFEMDQRKALGRFLMPPISDQERSVANLEGWILGVHV